MPAPTKSPTPAPAPTPDELAAKLAALEKENADLKARPASEFTAEEQAVILSKMKVGLTRDQAETVLRDQKANDAYVAAQAAKASKP